MSPNFLCCQKPLPPLSSTDEERQLQLALALSKEEHEKVPVSCSPGPLLSLHLVFSLWHQSLKHHLALVPALLSLLQAVC